MAGRGANIKNLNQKIIGDLKVPVPPISLQREFASFVEQTDKSKFHINMMSREVTACLMKIIQLNRW
jgi:type I restriction enzyme S subunit